MLIEMRGGSVIYLTIDKLSFLVVRRESHLQPPNTNLESPMPKGETYASRTSTVPRPR